MAVVAITISAWKSYSYYSIPGKEAEAEQLLRSRTKRSRDAVFARGRALNDELVPQSASQFGMLLDDSKLGDCWKRANKLPVTGIQLDRADLTDLDDRIFQRFPELFEIQLYRCQLNDAQFAHLFAMPSLRSVMISQSNGLPPPVLRALSSSSTLEILRLSETPLTDGEAALLGSMRGLKDLSLSGMTITDAAIEHLAASLPQLRTLEIQGDNPVGEILPFITATSITDRSCAALSGHPTLRYVNLNFTAITDKGIAHLASCPNLGTLTVRGTEISPHSLESLLAMPHLGFLDVEGTRLTKQDCEQLRARKQSPITIQRGFGDW
jgi:hypothetical protein